MMGNAQLERVIDFFYELGLLKRSRRTGWWTAGIKDPETIAEHSLRTAIVGYVLAELDGADAGKTAVMCLLHDSQETRTGDIPSVSKLYVKAAPNGQVTDDQTSGFPDRLRSTIVELIDEYERRESLEARLAHDADKLELVLQSREYAAQGSYNTSDWLANSMDALTTSVAKDLATLACQVSPENWWRVASKGRAAAHNAQSGND